MTDAINYSLKKALLVEDNEMNVKLFSLLLKRIGIEFDTAMQGDDALELFNTNHYDIILTDINLPKLSGDALARLIRQNSDATKANTPIIALTASILTSETATYLNAGINEVLIKPFTEDKFKSLLHQYLS